MIAHAFLMLKLWRRGQGGMFLLALLLLLPAIALGSFLAFGGELRHDPNAASSVSRDTLTALIWGVGIPGIANSVAHAVHRSRRQGHARLLRTSGLDGGRAVASHLLAGFLAATILVLAVHTSAIVLRPEPWIPGSLVSCWLLLSMVPPLTLPWAFLLPRSAAVVAATALVPASVFLVAWRSGTLDLTMGHPVHPEAIALWALGAQVACLSVLGPLWSRFAWRLEQ